MIILISRFAMYRYRTNYTGTAQFRVEIITATVDVDKMLLCTEPRSVEVYKTETPYITLCVTDHRGTMAVISMISPSDVDLDGPAVGRIGQPYTFTTTVSPATTTLPIIYAWQVTGADDLAATTFFLSNTAASFIWHTAVSKFITVTAANAVGTVSDTHAITVNIPLTNVVIDSHDVVREALEARLRATATVDIVGCIGCWRTGLRDAVRLNSDVVLLETQRADGQGLEALRHLTRECPCTSIVILTSYPDAEEQAGPRSEEPNRHVGNHQILKDIDTPQLVREIQASVRPQAMV